MAIIITLPEVRCFLTMHASYSFDRMSYYVIEFDIDYLI